MSRIRVKNGTVTQIRAKELKRDCKAGRIDRATIEAACSGFPWILDYILLSVMDDMGYDKMFKTPCCRNTFYAYRKQFFVNLDVELSKKQDS